MYDYREFLTKSLEGINAEVSIKKTEDDFGLRNWCYDNETFGSGMINVYEANKYEVVIEYKDFKLRKILCIPSYNIQVKLEKLLEDIWSVRKIMDEIIETRKEYYKIMNAKIIEWDEIEKLSEIRNLIYEGHCHLITGTETLSEIQDRIERKCTGAMTDDFVRLAKLKCDEILEEYGPKIDKLFDKILEYGFEPCIRSVDVWR